MRKSILMITLVMMLGALFSGMLWSEELKFPATSPKAMVMQTVGLTDMTIVYHRPGVKDRTIWGDLVPYDQNWRTGANNATTIEFSTDVTIGETKVPKGKYAIFTIPGKTEWTFIISKQTDIWGNMGYKESEDVVRVKATPKAVPHCEWMHFGFAELTDSSAFIYLHWEKVMVGFSVKVDTESIIAKNMESTMDRYWMQPYSAAEYAMKKGMLDKAKEYIQTSLAIKKIYWNMLLKAKICKEMLAKETDSKKLKEGKKNLMKLLEETVAMVSQLPERTQKYVAGNPEAENMLKECKTKK